MSQENPITTAFELQRRTLEQSQQALEQSIEFQKQLNDAITGGMGSQAEAQQRSVDVTRSAMESYLDTIESNVPGAGAGVAQVREAMEEQFVAVKEAQEEAQEMSTEGIDEYEDLSEQYLDALGDQMDMLYEAHADMEAQTQDFLNDTEEQLDSLREEASEQAQEQIERIQEQMGELREQVSDD